MNIFPEIKLTESEEEELITTFSTPVVRKYLQLLASTLAKELALTSQGSISDAEFCRRLAQHQGKLAAIETLMEAASITENIEELKLSDAFLSSLSNT